MAIEYFTRAVGTKWEQVTEQQVYDYPTGKHGKVLLVENQEELEIQQAMQFIYGSELEIRIIRPMVPPLDYLQLFSRVFTTWDPNDPNRI